MAALIIRRKIIPENPVVIGARFTRLTVIDDGWEQITPTGGRYDMVKVRCDCGVEKFIRPRSLWPRGIGSCGCLQREIAGERATKMNYKHGDAGTKNRAPEYGVYNTMLTRCDNPNASKFADYGGRGITVCERWRGEGGYERFIADMGRRPDGFSIDRIDSNGNYSPDNCRWASARDQANNRRSNRILEFAGRRQTLTMWAREFSMKGATLHDRLAKGWGIEKALTTPVKMPT